jgi:hypothetical protein
MALVGYQFEREKIESRIRELQALLKGKKAPAPIVEDGKPRGKRVLSQAARNRIAAAQRKRWAEHRKRTAEAARQDKSGA